MYIPTAARLDPRAFPCPICDDICGESNGVRLCLLALFGFDKSSPVVEDISPDIKVLEKDRGTLMYLVISSI